MPRKQKQVRKLSKKIAQPRRVVRTPDVATHDSGAIRFGSGCGPALLRK